MAAEGDNRARRSGFVLRLCALLALLAAAVAAPRPAHATVPSLPPHPGVISLALERQVTGLDIRARHFLRDEAALPAIPVRITASRDVAAEMRQLGGAIDADAGGRVLEGTIPAGQIDALAQIPGVRAVFGGERLHAHLDQSVPEIRANQVWALSAPSGLPIQGQHVLVGIVDSGIDLRNPDFRNPDGTTRIVSLWDQTASGTPPHGFTFGNECDSAAINSGRCSERDTDGHGTHVAGIAAGNGRSSTPAREVGVAPEADLVVVKADNHYTRVIAAWQYMIARAQALGEPIVINNSFGGEGTPHDGSSPISLALDRLSGPGRVFVASAGNSGNKGVHADDVLHQGATATFDFHATGSEGEVDLSLFSSSQDTLGLSLTNLTTGQTWGPVSGAATLSNVGSADGSVKVSLDAGSFDAAHHETDVAIVSNTGQGIAGHYRLTVSGLHVAATGRADIWVQEDGAAQFDRPDESDTVNDPADAHTVISVANYATRTSWTGADNVRHDVCDYYTCLGDALKVGNIKPSSSEGPTADGRQKPDIAAPGTMIISSRSADAAVCGPQSSGDCLDPAFLTPDGKNAVDSGTSMSAPHVAGVIALMLQVDPTLDPAAVDDLLRSNARHDQFTGTGAWTPTFGAGKLDALAAVQALRARPTPSVTPTFTPTATPAPTVVPDFSVTRVRLRATGKSSSAVLTRARTGTTVHVFVYWTVLAMPDGVKPSYSFSARLKGKTVWLKGFVGTRDSYGPGQYWATYSFKVRAAGIYHVTGGVTVAGITHTRTVTLTGVKR